MVTVTKTIFFNEAPQKLFLIMTNNKEYTWRSDIKKIEEIENGRSFIGYTKKNVPTLYHITKRIPNKEYCFTMENNDFHGKWAGFLQESGQGTTLTITETIQLKNKWTKPFVKRSIEKWQTSYLNDLTIAINKRRDDII
ncbi:MAG: polyketide cyclase [bacterium]|nr:polyketide cyclase [bacterium]